MTPAASPSTCAPATDGTQPSTAGGRHPEPDAAGRAAGRPVHLLLKGPYHDKCVLWDGTGFWLIQKRLVGYTFAWPMSEEEAMKISGEELQLLLQGIDVFRRFIPWADVKIS